MTSDAGKHWKIVSAYSGIHFLVDFACAFLMFHSIAGTQNGYLCVLLYNFCAFAMQMPLGVIADKWNRNFLFALGGCVLVGFAFGTLQIPVLAVIICGIGNAMFHLGGGIDVLNISAEKLGALGVFVSPGAFGVYFGTILGTNAGKWSGFFIVLISLVLFAAAGLIFVLNLRRTQRGNYPYNSPFSLEGMNSGTSVIAAVCLFFVVCLRSYMGFALDFSWKSTGYWSIALICAVVFGKTIGGITADRFGVVRTTVFSLGLAGLLFLMPQVPIAGVTAMLLFNMTMPITLWALAKIMPGAKGFAFGLLTFGLFLGFLPIYLNITIMPDMFGQYALIAALSLLILRIGLWRIKR